VSVDVHSYSKIKERTELYHWYLSKNEETKIVFTSPMHDLKAFEVVGVDSSGNDIVSETPSINVNFVVRSANYCVVTCDTDNKVVINGAGYSNSVSSVKIENKLVLSDEVYYDYVVDMLLHGNADETCRIMYDLYSKENSVNFKTLQDLSVGGLYNILGENYYIKRKKTNLDGIYEVEAV
jgi:hypothetical protein